MCLTEVNYASTAWPAALFCLGRSFGSPACGTELSATRAHHDQRCRYHLAWRLQSLNILTTGVGDAISEEQYS